MIAEGLGAEGGVLRGDDHGDAVVEGEGDEGEHDGGDEEGLGAGVALADAEDGQPEEADPHGGEADDAGGKEEEDEQGEEEVVYREDFGGFDKDEVDGLEDLDVGEDVAAMAATDGVAGFVDARYEHAGEDDEGEEDEEGSAD